MDHRCVANKSPHNARLHHRQTAIVQVVLHHIRAVIHRLRAVADQVVVLRIVQALAEVVQVHHILQEDKLKV